MIKIKLTKSELKKQRDSLVQFSHYLPTLQLKKQQLQIKIFEIQKFLKEKQTTLNILRNNIESWVGLLADPGVDIEKWIMDNEVWLHYQLRSFIILDDDSDMEPFMDRLINTDCYKGILSEDADKAIEMLKEDYDNDIIQRRDSG